MGEADNGIGALFTSALLDGISTPLNAGFGGLLGDLTGILKGTLAGDDKAKAGLSGLVDLGKGLASVKEVGSLTDIFAGVLRDGIADVKAFISETHTEPDNYLAHFGTCAASASALGLAAHGISALLSTSILGCLDLDCTGLAALVAKCGDFDTVINNSIGQFYSAYLGEPWKYKMNQLFTPRRPGLGDLLRFRSKRIGVAGEGSTADTIGQVAGQAGGLLPGFDAFKKEMAFQGYSEAWAKVFEDDLYTEPRHFELQIMGDNDVIPEPWWWLKCRRLGYNEQDCEYMVGGLQRRLARTWINGLVNEVVNARVDGYLTLEEYGNGLTEAGMPAYAQRLLDAMVERRRDRVRRRDEVALYVAAYDKDQIDGDALRAGLDLYISDADRVDRLVRAAEIRRYKRVYWTTATEQARKNAAAWRRLYIDGVITRAECQGRLIEGGYEAAAADLALDVDDIARDQQIVAEFRRWGLPRYRDMVVLGEITVGEYEAVLRGSAAIRAGQVSAAGYAGESGRALPLFPPQYIDVEIKLVKALLADKLAGRVERYELPHYERAYVVGLIPGALLRERMLRAGLSDAEQRARALTLDAERTAYASRRATATTMAEDTSRRDAERAAEALERQLQRDLAAARGLTERWAVEKSETAREQTRGIAEALIAEAGRFLEADAGRLEELTASLADALWWAHVSAA